MALINLLCISLSPNPRTVLIIIKIIVAMTAIITMITMLMVPIIIIVTIIAKLDSHQFANHVKIACQLDHHNELDHNGPFHNNQIDENYLQAAIYYFITALFMLLACFDTYFALPLNVSEKKKK